MPAVRELLRAGLRSALRPALAALLLAPALPSEAAAPPSGRIEPGFGVTPGGLVWTVEPAARRLVLRDPDGSERGAFPLSPDERHVLGVSDSGARVTAPTSDGFRRRPRGTVEDRHVEARYVFRFADGGVRATLASTAYRGTDPAFPGDEVRLLRREGERWTVVRLGPDGEAPVASIDGEAVRRAVGRPTAPRIHSGPEGDAVLFPGARGDAVVRLDRPGLVYALDPLQACGEGRARLALPHEEGVLLVSVRTAPAEGEGYGGRPLAVAEVVDDAGRLLRSVPLGPFHEVFPLPDGGLLGLDGKEAVRFDDGFAEVSRSVLPLEEGADPAATARVVEQVRRMESLGPRASGADWADLALLPGAPASRFLDRARADAPGALERLARAGDGGPEAIEGARALPLLLEALRPAERGPFLERLRERVEAGAPAWLRRAAAFALLAASPSGAPAWALPAAAEAIAAGGEAGGASLPDEAFTPELAELVTAVDRARIDRIARERPELAEALLAGGLEDALSGSFDELRFHAPARRFPRTLLDCTAGPPSAAGILALGRLVEAALEASPSPAALARGDADVRESAEARGPIAQTLLWAQGSEDPGLRASALAIGPLAGLPIDAARFRADVLRRPDLASYAFLGLAADRGLSPRAWQGLFLDLFFGARAASRDPSACALSGWPVLEAEGEGSRDRYCNLFAIVHFATLDLGDEEDPAFVSRDRIVLLADFGRSASAPPELRLELKLGRAVRGTATEEETLEILGERELAPFFRHVALARLRSGSPRVAAFLERELASGRVAPGERRRWLEALARVDAAAGDRVAAEAWTRGTVPLDGADGDAGAWARALAPDRVRGSEALRAALRRARDLPAARLEAATALARAGDPGSAGPLSAALLEACPSCPTPADLAALFGPLGDEGLEALARLAEASLPFCTTPLEALFELDAPRAESLARDGLAAALEAGCVPEPLLPVLLGHGVDPFPELLSALEARGCDRARLRPGEPVAAGIARAVTTEAGRAARRAVDAAPSETCRAALASLLGVEAHGSPEER